MDCQLPFCLLGCLEMSNVNLQDEHSSDEEIEDVCFAKILLAEVRIGRSEHQGGGSVKDSDVIVERSWEGVSSSLP